MNVIYISQVIISPSASPSTALVKHVKDLYHKRATDVRILIPVLTGLEKKEVVEVLPKLIKQSPNVVKEVFNRLLGCFHGESICDRFCFKKVYQLIVSIHTTNSPNEILSLTPHIDFVIAVLL